MRKKKPKKQSVWFDDSGRDYRMPFVISLVGLGSTISAILVMLNL